MRPQECNHIHTIFRDRLKRVQGVVHFHSGPELKSHHLVHAIAHYSVVNSLTTVKVPVNIL